MTIFAGIADIHMGNHGVFPGDRVGGLNTRARHVLAALESATTMVQDQGADRLLLAGDVFDTSTPPAAHIAAVQGALATTTTLCHVLVGNHDQVSSAPNDNAVAPLGPVAQVHQEPYTDGVLVAVPFRNTDKVEDYLVPALESLPPGQDRLLLLHAGIEDDRAARYMRGAHGSIHVDELFKIMAHHGIQGCLAGDWHEQRYWCHEGMEVAQIGALCPTGFSNPGWTGYGGLVLWDNTRAPGSRMTMMQLDGPRFIRAQSPSTYLAEHDQFAQPGQPVYAQITCPPDKVPRYAEQMEALVPSKVTGYRVLPSKAVVEKSIQEATKQAQDADNQAGALAAWVASAPLPDGLDRDKVLAICQEALTA